MSDMGLSKLYSISFNLNNSLSWLLLPWFLRRKIMKYRAVKLVHYARKWQRQALNAFKQQHLVSPIMHFCFH